MITDTELGGGYNRVVAGDLSLRLGEHHAVSATEFSTHHLASYEPVPGTVAYAGYGTLLERQGWDGTEFVPSSGKYETKQRGLFFKLSYLYRF